MTDPITRLNAALEGRYRVEREIGEGVGVGLSEAVPPVVPLRVVSLFQRIIPGFLHRYLGRLRFPTLFVLTTVVLLADLAVPDVLPFCRRDSAGPYQPPAGGAPEEEGGAGELREY